MTLDEVRQALLGADIDAHTSIGDDPGRPPGFDNTACLWRRVDGSWFVAWFERGTYLDAQTFASERNACAAFLDLLGLGPAPAGMPGSAEPRWEYFLIVRSDREPADPATVRFGRRDLDGPAYNCQTFQTPGVWRPSAFLERQHLLGGYDHDVVVVSKEEHQRLMAAARATGRFAASGVLSVSTPTRHRADVRWRVWSGVLLVGVVALVAIALVSAPMRGRALTAAALLGGMLLLGRLVVKRHVGGSHGALGHRVTVDRARPDLESALEDLTTAPVTLRRLGAPAEMVAEAEALVTSAEGPVRLLEEGRGTRNDLEQLEQLRTAALRLIDSWR
jgi:hypothetical protein